MILKKYTNRMILTISTLTILITNTPTKIKAYIPPIKGLYEIFTPDVIGIGQALMAKGWIENVYDFAPEDNLAKKVITSFWHKISDNEQLKPTELAPVSKITPQILGQILKYIRTFKNGNEDERKKIAEAWYSQCKNYIENKLPNKVDRDIEKAIEELNKKNNESKKNLAESEQKKVNLDNEIKPLRKENKTKRDSLYKAKSSIKGGELIIKKEAELKETDDKIKIKQTELEKMHYNIKKLTNADQNQSDKLVNLDNEIKQLEEEKKTKEDALYQEKLKTEEGKLIIKKETELKEKDAELKTKELELTKITDNIKKLKTSIKAYPKQLSKLKDENLRNQEIKKRTKSIETNITKIIEEIEKLAASKNFIPETAEAILWAFFEDKFTLENQDKSLENLSLCLDELDEKKLNAIFYAPEESKEFENTIKNLDNMAKIAKTTDEYDQSTYSLITVARTKNFPPIINSYQMEFQKNNMEFQYKKDNEKSEYEFATCFESVILDTLSILLYNPTNKTYDLTLLPDSFKSSEFFINIIDQVFKEKTYSGSLINPPIINTKFKNWINIIENKPGIEYVDKKNINDKTINYNLNTRIENLIKILNEFFNLGLEIEYNQQDPKILEISNFNKIIENPENAQDFLNEIFEFISKKLSTDDQNDQKQKNENPRKITFSCKLDSSSIPNFKISENKIKISDSYGIINIKIEYNNFNIDFYLHIESTHASVRFPARDNIALNYSQNFKKLLTENVYAEKNKQKLLPIFILLADLDTLKETDIKMQNLLFYCLNLKDINNKLEILKVALNKGLFEDPSFEQSIKQFIDRILENEHFASYILNSILKNETRNKIIDIIIEKTIKKDPIYLLIKILDNISQDWSKSIALQIINKNFYLNNPETYRSILIKAISNRHEDIFKVLSKNKDQFEAALKTIHKEILNTILRIKTEDWTTNIALKIINETELNNEFIDSILYYALTHEKKDIIKIFSEKYPIDTLNIILRTQEYEFSPDIALKIINEKNYLNNSEKYRSILIKAISNKHENIFKVLSKNKDQFEATLKTIPEEILIETIYSNNISWINDIALKIIAENPNLDINKKINNIESILDKLTSYDPYLRYYNQDIIKALSKKHSYDIILNLIKNNSSGSATEIIINLIKKSDLTEEINTKKDSKATNLGIETIKSNNTYITEELAKKYPIDILLSIVKQNLGDNKNKSEFENIAINIIKESDLTEKSKIYKLNLIGYFWISALKNKLTNITETLEKKYPENILIIIVNNKPDEFKNSALKIINDNPNIDLTKTDIKGNSILDYAIKNGHKDITDALSKLKTKNNHENKN